MNKDSNIKEIKFSANYDADERNNSNTNDTNDTNNLNNNIDLNLDEENNNEQEQKNNNEQEQKNNNEQEEKNNNNEEDNNEEDNNNELENPKNIEVLPQDSIKKIILDKNNNENSNNGNIIFDTNSDNNNINKNKFFSNDENIVIQEELIENIDTKPDDDFIYIQELENQLLSEYPVTKQNVLYIQKSVETQAKKLIEVKNLGVKNYELFEKGIDYKVLNEIINDKFHSKWIIPIILDKHRIYAKLKEDQEDDDNNIIDSNLNIYFTETLENKEGIIEDNQKIQLSKIKELGHNYALEKINLKEYLNQVNNLTKPYLPKYGSGYVRKPINDALVLRFYDYDNIYWNDRITEKDYKVSYDVRDEKSRKITGIKETTLIEGEEINILGFLITPNLNINSEYNYNLTKKFELVGSITKIFQSGDFIHVEIINHGLKNGDIINIENSNSFPNINATFSKSLKIIDENIISISSNKKIEINGNFGQIYVLSKLKYDMYILDNLNNSDKNDLTFKLKESLYNKEDNQQHNKIYLFDKHIIKSKSEYDNILKKIVPNLEQIIENEMHQLENAFTFENINNILKSYDININDIHLTEIIKIKKILESNLSIYEKNSKKNILNKNFKIANKYSNNNNLNSNYFLSNKFINNENIEKYYGVYRYINKPEDNLLLRLEWIQGQKDFGTLYYQYLLLDVQKSINVKSIKNIKDKLKTLNDLYQKMEKNYNKEIVIDKKNKKCKLYRFQPYIISEYDIENDFEDIKNWNYDNLTVFYNDNIFWWKNKKMVKMESIDDDTLALVKNTEKSEIWICKNDIWSKTDFIPEYDNIKYLCYLSNIDLKKIKLDTLDCIYRNETGCGSKLILRYESNLKMLKEQIDNFENLELFIKNDSYLKNIEKNIKKIVDKHFSTRKIDSKKSKKSKKSINEDEEEKEKEEIILKTPIEKFVHAILNLQNDYIKRNMIYNLIDKDALIIDKILYSKKYKTKMGLCGHYLYYKMADYSTNADERTLVIENMLNIYSDNGESKKNVNTCTVCGQELIFADYDETEGFSESGMIKRSRETWISEKMEDYDTLDSLDFFKETKVDCLDENFKKKLLSAGLSIEDTNEAIKICNFLTVNLSAKAGVKIPAQILINIIIDSMQKIKTFPPYEFYKAKEYKKFEEKGFSQSDIIKFEERFKEDYDIIKSVRVYSIISARFLIAIQTTIPEIVRNSESAVDERCSFYSFEGEEGSSYMVCLLNEMNLVRKDKGGIQFKNKFEEAYNEFKELIYIKELFKGKKNYDTQFKMKIEQKTKSFQQNNDQNSIEEEPEKITSQFPNKLKTSKESGRIRDLFNDLYKYLIFLAKKIKNTVKTVIAEQPSSDYTSVLENSCCTELADEYLGYYFFIINNTTISLKEIIENSKIIYPYLKYFVKSGTIHRFILINKNKFDGIYNPIIVDDDITTSKSIINEMFEIFVDTGFYAGTRRDYIKSLDSYIDIKTGKTKNEIINKEYSIKEYQELLKNIEKNNILYYKKPDQYIFDKVELNKLKKISNDKLNKIIKILLNNLYQVLNKNQDFIKKYEDLLLNFGLNIEKNNNLTEKELNKKRISLYKKRFEYFKKFYISKIHKFLSTIQNDYHDEAKNSSNINLNFIGKDKSFDKIKLELQESIFKENEKLDYFLNPEVRKNFMSLEMDYSNQEINSINGVDNIYDKDYEKIIEKSDFNFFDASNVILFIIISNLNNWILCRKKDDLKKMEMTDINNIENIDYKSLNCKYICQFILLLLDEIYEDYELFDLNENCSENIRNNFIHDIIEAKYKLFMKEGDDDSFSLKMKSLMGQKSSMRTELEENQEKYDSQDILQESEMNDKTEYILEKGKKELTSLLGHEPSADELETYKNNYMTNMIEDEQDDIENYDLDSGPKGADVLDQGAGYGELNEYDFENGDGFNYEADADEY